MTEFSDKIILFLICSLLCGMSEDSIYIIVPILIAVSLSCFSSYFTHPRVSIIGFLLYCILCVYMPSLLYYLPLLAYDIFDYKVDNMIFIALIPLGMHYDQFLMIIVFLLVVLTLTSFLLKKRTLKMEKLAKDYIMLRDETKELSIHLESKNKDLMERQDYEINLATLNERNRIAREIHDNVGHLLSRSILQIGALIAVSKDDTSKESLNTVKETLSTGMDSIRMSIHNIHEESMNLHDKLQSLIDDFAFCSVHFEYSIEHDLSMKAKYSIVYIVKEALSNVMKHSNATKVTITLFEHPALYQLIIQDNGTIIKKNSPKDYGMGVNSIMDRVSNLNGQAHITTTGGYQLFISIPKTTNEQEKTHENNNR